MASTTSDQFLEGRVDDFEYKKSGLGRSLAVAMGRSRSATGW